MNSPEFWMLRCLELASLGAGNVSPNPMVGAILVHNNQIIGEGWHQKIGSAHAEVNAINSVLKRELIPEATLYVNLEPCAHIGKTPPCANLIIMHKIPKVVVGMLDPNPLVAGKGIALLRAAGIEVELDVLNEQCLNLNKRFIHFYTTNKPYVILKWAQTRNGFISPDAKKMSAEKFEEERHITGMLVQKLVHKWRTQEDAIMVATNTALTDNPALNNRAWEGRAPARIVLDQHLRLPITLKLFDQSQKTFIANGVKDEINGNNVFLKLNFKEDWFKQLLDLLLKYNIQSIVVEGGATLLNHLIANNYWNEAIVFYSPKNISDGIKAPTISGKIIQQDNIDVIQMTQYRNL